MADAAPDGRPGGPAVGTIAGEGDNETLSLLAEEVCVSKEVRPTGKVRVSTRTHEREALVEETLTDEHVDIERVPVGRRIDEAPAVRQEGDTTIIPVVEEVLIVERRLILKEEIRITKVKAEHEYRELVALRSQEAIVTRESNASTDTTGVEPK